MSSVNFIDEFNVFMRYARSNMLTGRERLLWTALFAIANDRAFYNEQTKEYEWPSDFFPVPNTELILHSTLDKRGIESVRNTLKQRGLIDFRPGMKNKRPPEYKINYLSVNVGYKNVPNIDPNNVPKSVPSSDPNNVPKGVPSSDPFINKYNIPYSNCNDNENLSGRCCCQEAATSESVKLDFGSRMTADDYQQMDNAAREEIERVTDFLFTLYGGRKAGLLDYMYAAKWLKGGSSDDQRKLKFAFERAFRANRAGQWDYIEGVLRNQIMDKMLGREE